MLLRFTLQPCSLAKPFKEMAVGFYVHDDMNFVISERRDGASKTNPALNDDFEVEACALPGAFEV